QHLFRCDHPLGEDDRARTRKRDPVPAVHHLRATFCRDGIPPIGTTQPNPEALVASQPPNILHPEDTPPAPGQPVRPAQRSRLSRLCALPLLARPATQTMPWATLLAGCLAGTVYLAVMASLADTSQAL